MGEHISKIKTFNLKIREIEAIFENTSGGPDGLVHQNNYW